LQRLNGGATLFPTEIVGGAELLVVEGELIDAGQIYKRGSWIRLPVDAQVQLNAGREGVTVYLKTGHLAQIDTIDFEKF